MEHECKEMDDSGPIGTHYSIYQMYVGDKSFYLTYLEDFGCVGNDNTVDIEIKYCPWCGEKLEVKDG